METRIRPLSSPCEFGVVVFGSLTSCPFRICGATTMKMISSTSTTSTSGVILMDACSLAPSPSRIGRPSLLDHWRLDFRHLDVNHLELRYFEQAVHELGRSPVHLDVKSLYLAREVVEGDDGRDRDEDTQSRRHRGVRIASALEHAIVLLDARRDHLRHVGILVQPPGFDQILGLSPMKELLELGLELFRLERGRAEAAVLVYDHPHRKNGKQGEANHHRASE